MTRRAATVLVAVFTLTAGFSTGFATRSAGEGGTDSSRTTPSAVDIGFSQDMIVHHEQAVLLAQIVRDRTANPNIAALADGIRNDQLLDIGALRGYLALWRAPILPSGPPMQWMSVHAEHSRTTEMPGMATTAQLGALQVAKGADLDRMFLTLMLRHHEGGRAMISDAAAHASIEALRALAARMGFEQPQESQQIESLLAALEPVGTRGRTSPTSASRP